MKRYVHNDTSGVKFVGGRMLLPGEGREIDMPDEGDATDGGQAAHEEPPLDPKAAALATLRAQSVGDIKVQLQDISPELLEQLEAAEGAADKPRTTLLAAITEERLRRAAAGKPLPSQNPKVAAFAALLAQSVGDLKAQLPEIAPELLDQLEGAELAAEKPRSTLLTAIAEERQRRAAAV